MAAPLTSHQGNLFIALRREAGSQEAAAVGNSLCSAGRIEKHPSSPEQTSPMAASAQIRWLGFRSRSDGVVVVLPRMDGDHPVGASTTSKAYVDLISV